MKAALYLFRRMLALALLVSLLVPLAHAQSAQARSITEPSASPLERLLKPDGTLNLSTGFNGSLDERGWEMSLDAEGAPHLARTRPPSEITNYAPALNAATVPDDAYWDGRFDYPPGVGGTPAIVNALAVNGNDLYVAGTFTTTGSISVNYIAQWNPATGWSSLGNGVNNYVLALAVSAGRVYAGGRFIQVCGDPTCTIGNTTVNHIALWNGSSWSALGSGVNNLVFALRATGLDVYAGGVFSTARGKPSFYFAHWNRPFFIYLPIIEK